MHQLPAPDICEVVLADSPRGANLLVCAASLVTPRRLRATRGTDIALGARCPHCGGAIVVVVRHHWTGEALHAALAATARCRHASSRGPPAPWIAATLATRPWPAAASGTVGGCLWRGIRACGR